MTIRVVKPGLLTTVQDRGRYGYAHLGISPAGAADGLSLRIANLLVGNAESAPALEMTLLGATLEFDEPAIIAVCGANCEGMMNGAAIGNNTPVEARAGNVLRCGSTTDRARCYLAVQGGFDVPVGMRGAGCKLEMFCALEKRTRLELADWAQARLTHCRGQARFV